jgi:Xaa-Pro aminopeptidase
MRYKSLTNDLFIRNREKLSQLLDGDSVAVLHSNDQMLRNGDQYYPYRQNSDFFYLTGIEQEMSILLLCPEHKDGTKKAQLFLRKPDPKMETWEGRKLSLSGAREVSGIESIFWLEDFDNILHEIVLQRAIIYCRTGEQSKFRPDYPSRDDRSLIRLKEKYPAHQYKRLSPLLQKIRLIKEPEELDMIKEAIRITSAGFNRILPLVRAGMKEYEVEAELSHEFIRHGASGHAYPPIIASGENACTLHYIQNDCEINKGSLVLMDFGAEYGNYSADCSRTIPVNGRYSKRQREIYEVCLRLFLFAKSQLKPGTTIESVHKRVCRMCEEEHIRLGLYSRDDVSRQKKELPLFMQYYMHGTSHFLGLDVHDCGDKEQVLKEGMVLTCEPGIYISSERTAVRLENNLLITKEGNIDLMEDIPMHPDDIEEKMNS